jgi:hypothetical protein
MLEYKREKATLESQLKDIQKRSVDHDDHLRVIDAWWSQVISAHPRSLVKADEYSCWTKLDSLPRTRFRNQMPIVSILFIFSAHLV